MKKLLIIPLLALLLVGCATSQRSLFNSLATVEVITTGAYSSYLDLVVTGKLPTNTVPAISLNYNTFKFAWSAAVVVAQWQTNQVAPPNVVAASTKVLDGISAAKKGP
jgi:hypothetical protein